MKLLFQSRFSLNIFTSIFSFALFSCILFFPLQASKAKNIFEKSLPEEINASSLKLLQKLKTPKNFTENTKDSLSPDLTSSLASKRLHQYLILKSKKVTDDLEVSFVKNYLETTKPCLSSPEECLTNNSENKKYISAFYTYFTEATIDELTKSFKGNEESLSNFKRAKFVNLALNSLELGVQEVDGPNDDSKSGDDLIKQFFEASGIKNVNREMTSNKVDEWAWCAAFITALYNQTGSGFSFITQEEYLKSCKEMDKKSHCHPVQVDFILNWAKRKAKVYKLANETLQSTLPGDLLVLLNPKSGQASHIGVYLGMSKECSTKDYDECWVYTIEGNAGPFINDALEEDWQEVKKFASKNKIEDEDYERLLDRLTIVKRPAENWDYAINLFD